MKIKILIIGLLAMLSVNSFSQDIEYIYDAAGNCKTRKVIPAASPMASDQINTGGDNNETKESVEEPEVYEETLAEKQIRIYPNPTRGKLAIEIVNYNLNDVGTIQVFDMGGRLVQNITELSQQVEVDITKQAPGSYIVVISIGNRKSEWKVIKQ